MKFKQIRVNYGDYSKLVLVRDDHKNKPTFTQGPWKSDWVGEKPHGAAVVWIPDSSTCNERVEVHTSNARANARLIASAPEMHALLARVASDDLGDVQTAVELAMDARELLAKVEGEK